MSPVEETLRAANTRLREVVESKDAELRVRDEQIATLTGLVEALTVEVAKLRSQIGKDSSNSSTPTSKESTAAREKRKAERREVSSSRERSADRKRGGQKGHRGSGLAREAAPDDTRDVDPPAECSGCRSDLGLGADAGWSWSQTWEIPPIALEKIEYRLPRRRCGCCGKVSTALPPTGRAGTVSYGPNVNAAAVLLGSFGNVPVERTAALMEMLLSAPVSAGFVARAAERLADRLADAGFEEAMTAALRAEPVLGADETPVNVLYKDLDDNGKPEPGAEHVVVIRTPDRRLISYRPTGSRSGDAIGALGVLDGYTGYLVRDGYTAYQRFETTLAGVQQCCAHIIRRCKGVRVLGPGGVQNWTTQVREALAEAHQAVERAKARGDHALAPQLLADLRTRYDQAVESGRVHNRHRDWPDGNHPGHTLARWLARHADQVWLFTRAFEVPWTNNACEQAVKSTKRHQAVSGYWHTLATLGRDCRIRSYLTSARNHGIRAIDAVHAALAGTPWLPTLSAV
jgi:transposase